MIQMYRGNLRDNDSGLGGRFRVSGNSNLQQECAGWVAASASKSSSCGSRTVLAVVVVVVVVVTL